MIFNIGSVTENTFYQIRDAYDDGIRSFELQIDSLGGSLDSAFRIYDLLRSDPECVVSANVSGACYSAATVILCTAPAERRSADGNSTFLIHSPLMPVMQDVNKRTAEQIKSDIDSAYNQLQKLYLERTSVDNKDVLDYYMDNEKMFYVDDAIKLGLISRKNIYYNIDKNNRMSKIKNLINSIISQLKNETFVTKDNVTFEALEIAVGVPVDGLSDGVFELSDGKVITVEQSIIVDVVPPVEEPVTEPEAVKNEEVVETPVEEKKDDVVETVEQVAEEVTEAVSEEEIKQIVEEAISELKQELENKYAPMCELVNSLGGLERLKVLKNAKHSPKNFTSEKPKDTPRLSLEELMNKVRK